MASAGTVTVDFTANVAKFTAQLQQVNDRIGGVGDGLKKFGTVAKTAFAALSVGALGAGLKQAADAADLLGKTADRIGIATEKLKAFQIASSLSGVGLEQSTKLLSDAQRQLGLAAAGTGDAAKTIGALGLNIEKLKSLSPDQLFSTYSEAIATLGTRSEQAAAASKLFGESGSQSLQFILDGNAALQDAEAFTDRYALALSRVEIKQIENANDSLAKLGEISKSAAQRVAAGLAPAVDFFSTALLDATGSTKGLQAATEVFSATAITAFEILSNGVNSLKAVFFGLAAGVSKVFASIVEDIGKTIAFIAKLPGPQQAQLQSAADTVIGVSESLNAAVDANLAKAEESLRKIKSIAEIQQTVVDALENSRLKAQQQVDARAAQDAAARAGGRTLQGGGQSSPFGAPQEALLAEMTQQAFEEALEMQRQSSEAFLALKGQETQALIAEQNKRDEADAIFAQNRVLREQAAQQAIIDAQAGATDAAIGFLQAFAGKSKAAAVALVLINKARAIAMAIQNTALGATLQLTSGDPYTAVARAAAVKAFGAVQVGLIAATGIGEIAAITGGNSSSSVGIGTPNNPVFTQPQAQQQGRVTQALPQSQPFVTQVVFNGPVMGMEEVIVEAIRKATDNDVIVIGSRTAQAQMFQPAA